MLLVQGHTRDPQPGNQSPRHSPALWAVVTNDLYIRRCRAQSNNVIPVNISDEQPPHYFFNIIICCTCNMCPRAVEQATQATTRENLSSGFPTKRLNRLVKIEISLVASVDMIHLKQQTTKLLMRLRVCAGWSAPLLIQSTENMFFAVAVQLLSMNT